MSTFPNKVLINIVDSRWDNFFNMNSNGAVELSQLVGIANVTDTGSCFVNNCCDLPTACLNTGRILFACDSQRHFVSNGISWTSNFSLPVADSTLWAWGYNLLGQLGTNSTVWQSSPVTTAGGGTNWKNIDTGFLHAVGLKTDGTLWTWGDNYCGQLGDNSTLGRCSPGTVAGNGTTWCTIAGGYQHSAAIKTDGGLWTWGRNSDGLLGINSSIDQSSPVTVSGGGTNWCSVSAAQKHNLALKTDGTLWVWGYNGEGQLGTNGITCFSSPVTTAGGGNTWCVISGKYKTSSGIKSDGSLWTWGNNQNGKLGDGTTANKSSPGTVAGGGTSWSQVSLDSISSAMGIKTDGTLWTWGSNTQGTLGNNSTVNRSSPGTVSGGGTSWCQISAGRQNMFALKTDGTIWTWGENYAGVLGTNNCVNRSSPGTIVGGITTWCLIKSSYNSAFGIKL